MNEVSCPFLDKTIVVCLDDIFIYASSKEEHLDNLKNVFEVLIQHEGFCTLRSPNFLVTPHLTYTCLGSSKINYVSFVYVVLKLIM
jgi:hypothetical protein